MSTVRIQVRRGTSSEWTSANPILAAGEMGVETNTNKFKFGNGTDTWTALSYAASDSAAIGEISQDAINTALSMGAGLTKTYNDGANTITIAVDDAVIATVDYVDTAVAAVGNSLSDYIETADRGVANGVASLNSSGKVPESELDLDGVSLDIVTGGDLSASTISTEELTVTNITSGGHIGATNVTISGNLTVTGTTTTVDTTNLSVTDPLIQLGAGNDANTVDSGVVVMFNDGVSQHAGLVRDSSDNKWKLFKGVTDEPTTNVNFTQATLDTLALGALEATSATIGDVSNTELQYLNGVTSPIQTQIADLTGTVSSNLTTVNGLIDNINSDITSLNTALSTADADITAIENDLAANYAPVVGPTISNATFTGTLTLPNGSVDGTEIADSAIVNAKIAADAIDDSKIAPNADIAQTKIAGLADSFAEKAPLASPTFTGSVVLPSATTIGDVSATELGYVNGVTSAIQTQLDAKASATDVSSHTSDTTNIHGIVDTSLLATTANVADAKQEAIDAAAVASENYADGLAANYDAAGAATSAVGTHNNATTSVHGIADTSKLVTTDAQSTTLDGALTVQGNLTVNGTTFNASATSITIEDNLVQLAHQNQGNTVDLGLVVGYNDGGAKHSGLVRDVSDNEWKLFKGVTTEPTTTVDFTEGSLDNLELNNLVAAGIVFSDKTQTKAGVPSLTTIATAVSSNTTLDALGTDAAVRDSLVPLSGSVNVSFEATGNAKYAIGSSINFYQSSGTGANITGSGVTILSTPGSTLRTTNSSVTATKVAASTWLLAGDLKA